MPSAMVSHQSSSSLRGYQFAFVVLGLIIGAIFIEFANWSWVFWFVALVAIPIAGICTFLIPPQLKREVEDQHQVAKWKSLDLVGISILTGMPYGVTTSSTILIECIF